MATRGNYLNRFGGTSYQFTSRPLVRDFRYRVARTDDGSAAWVFPNGTYGFVEVDGVVDDENRVRVRPADPLRRVARGGHR